MPCFPLRFSWRGPRPMHVPTSSASKVMFNTLVTFALLATAAMPPVWSEPNYEPISAEAYVEDLEVAGLRNGNMPSVRMMTVGGCTLDRDAAYTLALMIEAAGQAGVGLYPGGCYRTLSQQHAAYEQRCPEVENEITEYDPATDETVVVGSVVQRECSGPPIAKPGTSNHGWGRAIDFTSNGRSTLDCNDAAFTWLNANASRFGWVHPGWARCGQSTMEPWHWEWGGVREALPLPPITLTAEAVLHRVR